MEITVVLGDELLPKKGAVESSLAAAHVDSRDVELICLDTEPSYADSVLHANPDYFVRTTQQRLVWKQALRRLRRSSCHYGVIICSAYGETAAGPELKLPIDIFRSLAIETSTGGGTIEIICLIDDVFGIREPAIDLLRSLNRRQLEWTFSQYIASQMRGKFTPRVCCFALHHPLTNLSNKITRKAVASVYLCHPINFFRRNPTHSFKAELDRFRLDITQSGLIVYDPLGIDEEVLISPDLGERDSNRLKIRPSDRWTIPSEDRIQFTDPELGAGGEGLVVSPVPSDKVSRRAKAQTPQRDFFWIECADVVVSWRPFLGNTHHAGVLAELQFALHKNKPILAFSPEEDGPELPSPFASMISTVSNAKEFHDAISELCTRAPKHGRQGMSSDEPPKYCDHTSVGVLIYNEDNELLLIERGTFPFGMAAPAGHVDQHASYEEAAIAEAREEVGLDIKGLRLVAEGRRDNPCRRVNGTWHYWKIYEARASGIVKLSAREAKRAEWCGVQRLVELGMISSDRAEASDGSLERVWLDWLYELQVLPNDIQKSSDS